MMFLSFYIVLLDNSYLAYIYIFIIYSINQYYLDKVCSTFIFPVVSSLNTEPFNFLYISGGMLLVGDAVSR